MMIARNWMQHSVTVDGRQNQSPLPSPAINEINLPEQSGSFLPSRRDREVPYGMKGGER